MSIEANTALFRRFMEEVANRGNLAAVDEVMAPDFTEHGPPSRDTAGPGGGRARCSP